MSNFGDLPQDLVKEFLISLPRKSLLRFKCVSKSFCSMINSQHFIESRFARSYVHEMSRKLFELQKIGDRFCAFEFNDDFQRELALVEPMSSRLYDEGYSYCNGLVLLHILDPEVSLLNPSMRGYKFSLWNPCTGEYRVLPYLPLKSTYVSSFAFGLGYDSTIDDYKAVVFIDGEGWSSQVWIFEMKSGHWRTILDGNNIYFPWVVLHGGNRDGFVDNALHFICLTEDEDFYMIVSFDVAKETFLEVKFPDFGFFVDNDKYLNVIGGCLAICFFCRDGGNQVVHIDTYIQKKDGNEVTWTRLYSVREEHISDEVFGSFSRGKHAYSREGDKVFFSANGKLFSYDYKKKHLQETEVEMKDEMDLLFCRETAVSLDAYCRFSS